MGYEATSPVIVDNIKLKGRNNFQAVNLQSMFIQSPRVEIGDENTNYLSR